MRRAFVDALLGAMESDPDVVLLTADVGYGLLDPVRDRFADRFHNVGAAEQAMIGMGVGLALADKKPVCYSITPFLLFRPFELLRNYLHRQDVPVLLVGSGRDDDYREDGFTHWAHDAHAVLGLWPAIESYWPNSPPEAAAMFQQALSARLPAFLSLRR